MSKGHAGLFALLGLTGLGTVALAASRPGQRKEPRDPSGTATWTLEKAKTDWRTVYDSVSEPPAGVQPRPKFKVGDWVVVVQPAGEPPDPIFVPNRPYRIMRYLGRAVYIQLADGSWTPHPNPARGLSWVYELDLTAKETGPTGITTSAKVEAVESWLRPSTAPVDQAAVKQVAQVLAPSAKPVAPTPSKSPEQLTKEQEAAMNLPLYPQGLVVSKGSVKGTVISISKSGDTYSYKIEAGMGPFTQDYAGTQDYVMNMLAEKTGQKSYGFAFPAGVTLQMKSLKVFIKERKHINNILGYVTDTLGEITEPALIVKLYQAQKG